MKVNSKLWLVREFDNLELFSAKSLHYSYSRHSHPTYSIGFIEAGVGGNFYRGSTYLAPPGSIIFMNPDEAHTGYSAANLPLSYRMIYPSVNLIGRITSEMGIKGIPYFREAAIEDWNLARSIFKLARVLEQSEDNLERESCLIEVLSRSLSINADLKNISGLKIGKEPKAVKAIATYLHDNYNKNISLEQLVRLTNLNRSYIVRLFRKQVGLPPYVYLTQIRVEKAKQLLAKGEKVADVAIAVGMSDQAHLTRHFKRIVGITPGRYRNMNMSISFKTQLD